MSSLMKGKVQSFKNEETELDSDNTYSPMRRDHHDLKLKNHLKNDYLILILIFAVIHHSLFLKNFQSYRLCPVGMLQLFGKKI